MPARSKAALPQRCRQTPQSRHRAGSVCMVVLTCCEIRIIETDCKYQIVPTYLYGNKNRLVSKKGIRPANMVDRKEVLQVLLERIETGQVLAADVARHLRISPARITEMKQGHRQIKPKELVPLAEYLGLIEKQPATGHAQFKEAAKHVLILSGMSEAKSGFYAELIEQVSRLLEDIQSDSSGSDLSKEAEIAARAVWKLRHNSEL